MENVGHADKSWREEVSTGLGERENESVGWYIERELQMEKEYIGYIALV